jgi:hypothetical protein
MIKAKRALPDYFVSRKNTLLQVFFTALFAFFFINIYRPFGAGEWYDVRWWAFIMASGGLVLAGMIVIILSRLLMFAVKKRKPISVSYYVLMVTSEVLLMGALYAILELMVLGGIRPFGVLLYVAIQNTSLILLIPYAMSLLYFAWREKKMSLEALVRQIRNRPRFILFKDENDVLRLTLKSSDLIYLEASDNYVLIHFQAGATVKSYLLRNTLKRLERVLDGFPLLRCHRSFMVNMHRVKMLKRDKGQFKLWMDEEGGIAIPVSRSYIPAVTASFENVLDVGQ